MAEPRGESEVRDLCRMEAVFHLGIAAKAMSEMARLTGKSRVDAIAMLMEALEFVEEESGSTAPHREERET